MPTFIFQTRVPAATPVIINVPHAEGTLIVATAAPSAMPSVTVPPAFRTSTAAAGGSTQPTATQTVTFNQTGARACDNVLYPVKVGQHWTYKVSTQGRTGLVVMGVTSVNGQQASVDVSNQGTGIVSHALVDCQDDTILNFPFMEAGVLIGDALQGSVDTRYVSGVLAPNQSQFEAHNWGLDWQGNFSLSGSGHVRLNGTDFGLTLADSPLNLHCQTTGLGDAAFESVTVAAGTFSHALKVVCTAQTKGTGSINGQSISGVVTGQTTQWFAPNIGLLKMQVDSTSIKVLRLFSIPLTVDGNVELSSFQAAP
jgi:hypothetical protein